MNLLEIILLILAGFILDALITLHTRWVAEDSSLPAAISSLIYILSSFVALEYVLVDHSTFGNKFAYAIGAAIGCYLAIELRKKLKKRNLK